MTGAAVAAANGLLRLQRRLGFPSIRPRVPKRQNRRFVAMQDDEGRWRWDLSVRLGPPWWRRWQPVASGRTDSLDDCIGVAVSALNGWMRR